jgi:phosphatidylglycerophosphate synthase
MPIPTDLPNLLTLSRIAAIPLLVVLVALCEPWGDGIACLVFAAAAITAVVHPPPISWRLTGLASLAGAANWGLA